MTEPATDELIAHLQLGSDLVDALLARIRKQDADIERLTNERDKAWARYIELADLCRDDKRPMEDDDV